MNMLKVNMFICTVLVWYLKKEIIKRVSSNGLNALNVIIICVWIIRVHGVNKAWEFSLRHFHCVMPADNW